MSKYIGSDYPLLVFIGPSGAGKSSLMDLLVKRGAISFTPTWTDRPRRRGEVDSAHHFVDHAEMLKKRDTGQFLHQPIKLFGLPYLYALPKIEIPPKGQVTAINSRIMLRGLMTELFPNHVLYQIEAPKPVLLKRLSSRADQEENLGTRVRDFDEEIEQGRRYAKRIFVNDDELELTADKIISALHQDFASSISDD